MTLLLQNLLQIICAAFAAWGIAGMITMFVEMRKRTLRKRRINEVFEFRLLSHSLFHDSIMKLPSANEMILDKERRPMYKYLEVFIKHKPAELGISIPAEVNAAIKKLIEENRFEDALVCILTLHEMMSEADALEILNGYLIMARKKPWTEEDFEISKQVLIQRGIIEKANNG
jgi:hypothetical protein